MPGEALSLTGCECHEDMPTLFSLGLAHSVPSVSAHQVIHAQTHRPGEKQGRGSPVGTALSSCSALVEEGAVGREWRGRETSRAW